MYTGSGPLRQLRAQARAALPPRAFLKRDRGEALFVSNAPALAPELRAIPGFLCERRGGLMYLLPDASWLTRWERRQTPPPDGLCADLARFRGMTPDRENLTLFARCAKLTDARPAPEETYACARAVRQRAAMALRGGCGGGLYACAILLAMQNDKLNDTERKDEP